MSTLSVSNITTPTNTTPLVLSTSNSQAAFVRVEAANNDIIFNGTTKFLGTLAAAYIQSDSINAAFSVANASYNTANTVSGATVAASYNTTNVAFASINSNWTVTNTIYGITNASYGFANSAYASLNSNWTVSNTIYSVANDSYASINSNWAITNAAYNTANAAYANSNTKVTTGKSIAMAIVFS